MGRYWFWLTFSPSLTGFGNLVVRQILIPPFNDNPSSKCPWNCSTWEPRYSLFVLSTHYLFLIRNGYTTTSLLLLPPYCSIINVPLLSTVRLCINCSPTLQGMPWSTALPESSSIFSLPIYKIREYFHQTKTTYMRYIRPHMINKIHSTQSAAYPAFLSVLIFISVELPIICQPVPLWVVGRDLWMSESGNVILSKFLLNCTNPS